MNITRETESAYKEINEVLKKHAALTRINPNTFDETVSTHMLELKMIEYGYNIKSHSISNSDYCRFNNAVVSWFGPKESKHSRIISNYRGCDKDKPNNEYLVKISFPTGAYSIGNDIIDYPEEIFNSLLNSIKEYKPDFTDPMNHKYYFRLDRGADIFNNINNLIKEARANALLTARDEEIKKLESKLAELKSKK